MIPSHCEIKWKSLPPTGMSFRGLVDRLLAGKKNTSFLLVSSSPPSIKRDLFIWETVLRLRASKKFLSIPPRLSREFLPLFGRSSKGLI